MSECKAPYSTQPGVFTPEAKPVTMSTELDTLRSKLSAIECDLIALLVTVQRAQGKEPSVLTRRERRGR